MQEIRQVLADGPYKEHPEVLGPCCDAGGAASGYHLPPRWPDSTPELLVVETLTLAKLGVPSMRGQSSAEVIYQQSITLDDTVNTAMANRQKNARLFDATRA